MDFDLVITFVIAFAIFCIPGWFILGGDGWNNRTC
jgi:hypothetical protein